MNLEIHKPELVQRVNAHIREGHYHDADEVLEKALDALDQQAAAPANTAQTRNNLADFLLNSPFAKSDLNLERKQDYGRPVDL